MRMSSGQDCGLGESLCQFHSLRTSAYVFAHLWLFIYTDHSIQVYAAVSSVSLSLIATGIDATFDFGSNIVLYWIHKKAMQMDVNKWPVGGARLETIGNIIYGE
jgi:divalent metal cation (Fe/Co/Zn/Cd) transporter